MLQLNGGTEDKISSRDKLASKSTYYQRNLFSDFLSTGPSDHQGGLCETRRSPNVNDSQKWTRAFTKCSVSYNSFYGADVEKNEISIIDTLGNFNQIHGGARACVWTDCWLCSTMQNTTDIENEPAVNVLLTESGSEPEMEVFFGDTTYDDELFKEVEKEADDVRKRRQSDTERFGKNAVYVSHSLNPQQIITQTDFTDIAELSPERKEILRRSVLSVDAAKTIPLERGKQLLTTTGRWVQGVAILITLFVLSITPLIEQEALKDPATGKKSRHFLFQSPFLVSYAISITLGYVVTFLYHGPRVVKDCWNWKALACNTPSAALYAWGEAASMAVQVSLDGTIWKVMNQTKLFIYALFGWVLFGKKQTATQWGLITATTAAVVAYCLTSMKSEHIDMAPMIQGTSVIAVCSTAGIYSEFALKRLVYSFPIQMAQARSMSALSTLLLTVWYMYRENTWHKFLFGGWTPGVWVLVLTLTVKDWLSAFIIKSLDNVWKSLVTAFSLGLTYIFSCWYFNDADNEWSWMKFALVFSMMLDIMAYALAKRDQAKIMQLSVDSEKKIRSSRSGSMSK